jgi:hypothetical protein
MQYVFHSCKQHPNRKAIRRVLDLYFFFHGHQFTDLVFAGYAVPTGSVVIDVTNITNFSVDKAANTATFGPGLRLGQLYLKMYLEANSLFPAGTCPWVGTPGHLLGIDSPPPPPFPDCAHPIPFQPTPPPTALSSHDS